MNVSIRSLLLFAVLIVAIDARAQSERKQVTGPLGSISGRVTIGGNPAPRVKVIASRGPSYSHNEPVASARTDQYGQFQLTGLPSDHYHITAFTPAYIFSKQEERLLTGKAIPLAEGETIEGLDFALIRGGVITGRITDADGQPLMGEYVEFLLLSPNGEKQPMSHLAGRYNSYPATDDRGIYRIFGLPPGRYLVSAGRKTDEGGTMGQVYSPRPHTFYPGVSDESKARIVELAAGSEATGIDIALGRPIKTYSASGRVIDGATGKPLPDAQLGYGSTHETVEDGAHSSRSSFSGGLIADAKGNFRLDGLLPGNFHIVATPGEESGLYSNVTSFQIKDQDISGLEIKISRGSSISGVLTVEGVNDPEVIAKLSGLKVGASVSSPDIPRNAHATGRRSAVSSDGGFNIVGLHPGKVFLVLNSNDDSKGFFISRVERGGAEYADGIEVRPGEQVSGVRIILGYSNGRIRGQVKIEGGKLPPDAIVEVRARLADGNTMRTYSDTTVDPNGRFLIEGLPAGQYSVSAAIITNTRHDLNYSVSLADAPAQTVSVTSGVESEVVLIVKVSEKRKDK